MNRAASCCFAVRSQAELQASHHTAPPAAACVQTFGAFGFPPSSYLQELVDDYEGPSFFNPDPPPPGWVSAAQNYTAQAMYINLGIFLPSTDDNPLSYQASEDSWDGGRAGGWWADGQEGRAGGWVDSRPLDHAWFF